MRALQSTLFETEIRPKKPIIRYLGGKWRLAPWIISHFLLHEIYVEPFCGSASVLLRKTRSKTEVIGDLHGRVTNLMTVLRNSESSQRLAELVHYTPFTDQHLDECMVVSSDPLEDARRMLILGRQAYSVESPGGHLRQPQFRRAHRSHGRSLALEWADLPVNFPKWTDRLRGVFIETSDYKDLIAKWDSPKTLFYLDPPYLTHTRGSGKYGHKFDYQDHTTLLELATSLKGTVVLSGYDNELYRHYLARWRYFSRPSLAQGAVKRMEVLWIKS